MAESFREALYCPLARAVDAEGRDTTLATDTGDLLDHASRWLLLTHDFHRFLGHLDKSEEVDFHLRSILLLGELFENTRETVASIVDDDIDTLELVNSALNAASISAFLVTSSLTARKFWNELEIE
jgi:hypothetical protein